MNQFKYAVKKIGYSSSNDSGNKIDTSLFVQKPYLRTNYIESNIEEDIDLKNQYRVKQVPDPISIGESVSKNYVVKKVNDPSMIKKHWTYRSEWQEYYQR